MLNVGAFILHPSLKTSGHGLCLSMDNCQTACLYKFRRMQPQKVQSFGIPFCKGAFSFEGESRRMNLMLTVVVIGSEHMLDSWYKAKVLIVHCPP